MKGVIAVPPLARKADAHRSIDFAQNDRIVRHIAKGGITRFLYGGNAFVHHLTLAEYANLLDWLQTFPKEWQPIPSVGPSYGRAMDQTALLRKSRFSCAMALPCGDPRDAAGLEAGLREIADAAAMPLTLYIKKDDDFGADREAGLDAVAKLVESGVCIAIKYAIVRADPSKDEYLSGLLQRVNPARVISGMGERPAVTHLRQWGLPGFTTGSGCVASRLSQSLYEACAAKDFSTAERLRTDFLPLEDLRDAWGPARVLHAAVELAGIASTGPIPPFVSALAPSQRDPLRPVVQALLER